MLEQGPVVYVVNDDPGIRQALDSLIRSVGFRVQTFASARDFLDRNPVNAPGCLVFDVRLPGPSGLALQQELVRADVRLPIIFMTGHGDIPMSVRAMKAGAVEFSPFANRICWTPSSKRSSTTVMRCGKERTRGRARSCRQHSARSDGGHDSATPIRGGDRQEPAPCRGRRRFFLRGHGR
jgi:FixJ family two-component response regulator